MILYFKVENRVMLYFKIENRVMNKKTNYSMFGVNIFLLYYIVKNRVSLKYFYSKLYFRVKNRALLEMPLARILKFFCDNI